MEASSAAAFSRRRFSRGSLWALWRGELGAAFSPSPVGLTSAKAGAALASGGCSDIAAAPDSLTGVVTDSGSDSVTGAATSALTRVLLFTLVGALVTST